MRRLLSLTQDSRKFPFQLQQQLSRLVSEVIAKSGDNERRAYEAAQAQEEEEETTATNESSGSGDNADDR
ncbi:hypothetical protein FOCC_FOCC013858 [Frankliniella occidentalis]|nr:hypothetical protein FOCC_FOCC013858 [Frankliniella occidentalis]